MDYEGVTISAKDELISKLSFSKEGDHWESNSTPEGDVVVAVDCTQDEAILSAGRSRELINTIQQLRKAMGLDLSDKVEVFFEECAGMSVVESAVSSNVSLFAAKFQGSVPLPKKFAPTWSVVLRSDSTEIGGSTVEVSICRPAVAGKDGCGDGVGYLLSTLEPSKVSQSELSITLDGKEVTLKKGEDYWVSTVDKLRSTGQLSWLLAN